MRDDKYWDEISVNTMLMTEKQIIDYEKDLENLYISLSADIEKEISYIYSKYGKNDKILYADLRKRIQTSELNKFKSILKSVLNTYDTNIVTKDFLSTTNKLSERKTITVLEYIQYMCQKYIMDMTTQNSKYVYELLYDVVLSAYCVYFYNYVNGIQKDIEFIPISDNDIQQIVKNKWGTATYLERLRDSSSKLYDNIQQTIPRYIAMGFNSTSTTDGVNKLINSRYKYDITVIRTTGDYMNNAAHKEVLYTIGIDSYRFVAILDNRTTEECRKLNNTVYKLSNAKVGINFPPIHFNCRSSVAPVITPDVEKKLSELDDISRKNTMKNWLDNNLPKNQIDILKFIGKYY